MNALVILPILVILVIMLRNRHMLLAGLIGGIAAMIIGGVGLPKASSIIMDTIPGMTSMITPVIYCTTALIVAKSGGFDALMKLSQKVVGDKEFIIAPIVVLIQSLATYAAGLGAGNTMVTAPIAFAILGANPSVIAGMAIGTAASFMTSPSSGDSATIAAVANIQVNEYTSAMLPFTVALWVIAMIVAGYGVWKKGSLVEKAAGTEEIPLKTLLLRAIPPVYFLIIVVAGSYLNQLLGGYKLFGPIFNMISTLALTTIINRKSIDKVCEELVENSSFLLTKLFSIGLFLGFINILAEIGTFVYIAEFIKMAPPFISVPTAVLITFLIAIPAGGYSVGVSALVMPILVESGLTVLQLGLAAFAIGMGTQISPAQINVAALSQNFKLEMPQIIKINMPYMVSVIGMLLIIGFFV